MTATELEARFIAEAGVVAGILKSGSPIDQTVKKMVAARISEAMGVAAQYVGMPAADALTQALLTQYRTATQLQDIVTDVAERDAMLKRLDTALEAILPGDVQTASAARRAAEASNYAGIQSAIDTEAALKGWNPPAGKAN